MELCSSVSEGNSFGGFHIAQFFSQAVQGIGAIDKASTLHALCAFAHFAEPMTASLADRRKLSGSLSAFAAFQWGHL
jgi:hypothetical protein